MICHEWEMLWILFLMHEAWSCASIWMQTMFLFQTSAKGSWLHFPNVCIPCFCAFKGLSLCYKEINLFEGLFICKVQKLLDEKHFYTVHLKSVNAKNLVKSSLNLSRLYHIQNYQQMAIMTVWNLPLPFPLTSHSTITSLF